MKRSFLLIALAIAGNLASQSSFSLTVKSTSAGIAANSVLSATTIPDEKHTITIDLTNTSAVTHTYDVKRYDIVVNRKAPGDSAVPNFCFATLCTGQDVTVSIIPLILNGGESASTDTAADYNMLDADLIEASAKGFSYIKYTLYESNNPNDSIQFAISYNSTQMLVGLQTEENLSALNIYPNPAKDEITVSSLSSNEGKSTITITDAIGKVVYTKELASSEDLKAVKISVSELPGGFYFLILQQGENKITRKVVVE